MLPRLDPESVDVLRIARPGRVIERRPTRERRQYTDELLAVEPEDRSATCCAATSLVEETSTRRSATTRKRFGSIRATASWRTSIRHNRTLTHWLQWPIYPIQRFGPIKVWGAYLALLMLTIVLDLRVPDGQALVILYLVMVVYSWTVAPLSRWLMQRKLR